MFRMKYLIAACVLALAVNAGAADAAGYGGGKGGWHGIGKVGWHKKSHRGLYFGNGYYVIPNYNVEPVAEVSTPPPLGPVIPPSFSLSCQRSREIVAVPSLAGGDRQIKIIRC